MNDVRVQHSNWSSRIGTTIVIMAFVALAAAPWWAERANLRLLAEIYAYVALASLWNLLAGYAGLVSVGQQAYVGLGGYALFYLTGAQNMNVYLALAIADRGYVLETGTIALTGSAEDLAENEQVRYAYLGE